MILTMVITINYVYKVHFIVKLGIIRNNATNSHLGLVLTVAVTHSPALDLIQVLQVRLGK